VVAAGELAEHVMMQPMNRQQDSRLAAQQEALSAMADGEASSHEAEQLCAAWRDDADARGRWHAYHLIGDVLRSEELAARPGRDEAFLQALRGRLAEQPVVLAPAASGRLAARRRWMRWAAPGAVAAGFVAVAGVLVVARQDAVTDGALVAGGSLAASAVVPVAAATAPTQEAVAGLANGPLLRNARLDRYLSAHRGAAAGGAALSLPGGDVRRVDMLVSEPGQ
jgi:sigma-E factor negative regulatory protein RseA